MTELSGRAAVPEGFSPAVPYVRDNVRRASDDPGVHVVWSPEGEALYVGRTRTQRERLLQHLSGDRSSSVLHEKVGRLLDDAFGREASKQEIQEYLATCTVAWRHADDPGALKGDLVRALAPRFNELVPVARPSASPGSAWHVVVRWNPSREPNTVTFHREVADSQGSVWWRQIGTGPGFSAENLARFLGQLRDSVPTFAFLRRQGEVWRAQILAIEPGDYEPPIDLVPSYYEDADARMWFQLAEFEAMPADYPEKHLVFAQGRRRGEPIDFSGQNSLLLATLGSTVDEVERSVWWVNQGYSYARERDGGYLWAPNQTRSGQKPAHHSNVLRLRPGDVVIHYANTEIRAIGRVTGSGAPAARPAGLPDDAWGSEGYKASVEYFELRKPIAVHDILDRSADAGPFDTSGGVKQVYLVPISASFARGLRAGFLDRWPAGSPWYSTEAPPASGERDGLRPLPLSVDLVGQLANDAGLLLEDDVVPTVVAALNSGKHVILTGPPGTAKTTLATLVAKAAVAAHRTSGYRLTTATSDWTTFETVGGLRPTKNGLGLEFAPGQFVDAISKDEWLVVDELNRSNFDRAFGQLFTVLAGQTVELPYSDPMTGLPIELSLEDASVASSSRHTIHVTPRWRMIATMNVFDKSLLYEMSFALMRRFCFVEVGAPADSAYIELVRRQAHGDSALADRVEALIAPLLRLRRVKELGPSLFIDMAAFARERLALASAPTNEALRFQLFYSYLLPQFEGINDREAGGLYAALRSGLGPDSLSAPDMFSKRCSVSACSLRSNSRTTHHWMSSRTQISRSSSTT